MKILSYIFIIISGAFLFYSSLDMPDWGDPESPACKNVCVRYITDTIKDTATPNIVTSVLADYRGYDTLGETTVIFSAGVACILILRNMLKRDGND